MLGSIVSVGVHWGFVGCQFRFIGVFCGKFIEGPLRVCCGSAWDPSVWVLLQIMLQLWHHWLSKQCMLQARFGYMYVMYIFYDRSYLCAVYQRAAKLLFLTLNPHGYLIFNAHKYVLFGAWAWRCEVAQKLNPPTRGWVSKFATMLHSMLRQNLNKKSKIREITFLRI